MSLGSVVRLFVVGGLLSGLAVACVVESDRPGYAGSGGGSAPPQADAGVASTCATTPSTTPIVADLDTDQTMNATPGDGVGVFVEYAAGGHWHVWWTCDTNKTGKSCDMDVAVSIAAGAITNATSDASSDKGGLSTTAQKVESKTTTTTTVDGVRFDTAPGAKITLTASVDGCYDGSFLFFVQGGKVNGGYAGVLTDPIQLEGSAP